MKFRRIIRPNYVLVGIIVLAVMGYLLGRPLFGSGHAGAQAAPGASATSTAPPLVEVKLVVPAAQPDEIDFRGHTQALRTVVVRSQTAGPVAVTPVLQGTLVSAGTVLCRLAVDARQAQLDEARADMRAKTLQMQAADMLASKGYRSKTQLLSAKADLDAASATVRQAEVALRQVDLRAPFTGVFDHRDAEVGTYLTPGGACGTMIQLDPLLIVGDVPETDLGKLRVGDTASAKLVTGRMVLGRVRFVAKDADPATRTYRVEVIAPNPANAIASGLSAEIAVKTGVAAAHFVPVSAFVLDSGGRQGLRYVRDDGVVAFAPVKILRVEQNGAWVSGLSGPTRVITVGQSYVSEGQKVRVAQG
ncbi:MAG TPA: efflux RND transporter periplasmic adaptor subunit [Caulobacteraceae bacterium]|nr:efflux RND transporter periplasmic adaptor subunit [Caulobacteraceae bacterium]